MQFTSRLTTWFLAGCLATAFLPATQGGDKKDYLSQQDTLNMFEYEIEFETMKRVNKSVNPEKLIEEIGLRPPVMPPTLSHEQVRAQVETEISAAVEAAYPAAYFNQIKIDALQKHRLYSIGEDITITARNRNGMWTNLSGALRQIDDNYVRIGDQRVNKEDIRSSDHVHFYREEHTLARDNYSRNQRNQYEAKRDAERDKQRRALEFKIWRRYGYIYLRSRNQYVPESDYYLARLNKEREDRYSEIRGSVESSIMKREGWRWDPDTNTYINTRVVAVEAISPQEERDALDDLKDFLGGNTDEKKKKIPTLVGEDDESFNFWGPGDDANGGDLFEDGKKPAAADGTKAAPAPAPTPKPNDQVESIFDED